MTGIILPRGAGPKMRCTFCGHPFWDGEQRKYAKHVRQCVEANEEEIAKASPRNHELFAGSDRELEDYVAKHRQEILEGRKRIS